MHDLIVQLLGTHGDNVDCFVETNDTFDILESTADVDQPSDVKLCINLSASDDAQSDYCQPVQKGSPKDLSHWRTERELYNCGCIKEARSITVCP
jgi:hypothetical protein